MGVYINMEMPKNGSCIQIVIDDDGKVYPSVEKCILKMGSIAKAVPVLPHGDLIDRSQLCDDSIGGDYGSGTRVYYAYEVEHAPVIIPADPAEEGE